MLEYLWDEFWTEIHRADFSIIAARLLHEEINDGMSKCDRRDFERRHDRHIRASKRHMRRAKRVRRKIKRYEGRNS